MDPKIYIIIVNYNGEKYLRPCLDSLQKQTYKNFKTILVDNKSDDNSLELVRKNYKEVEIIENDSNYGFAKGNNVGIKHALENGADYVLLLNQDTVTERNLLESAIRFGTKQSDAELFVPKIKYFDSNKFWWVGAKLFSNKDICTKLTPRISEHIDKKAEDRGQYDSIREVESITGCVLFVKKDVFTKIGYLDEEFFMYGEDLDFSLRAQKAGIKMYYYPSTTVWHVVPLENENQGKSFGKKLKKYSDYLRFGIYKVLQKHYPWHVRICWLTKAVIFSPLFLIRGNSD